MVREPRALAFLLLPELGRKFRAEVFRFRDLADLALAATRHLEEALRPRDRVFLRLRLEQREARDQLLGFGEGPVGHGDLPARTPDACTLGARQAPLGGE